MHERSGSLDQNGQELTLIKDTTSIPGNQSDPREQRL